MSSLPTNCSKCSGALVHGFTAELTGGPPMVGFWVEGEPKKAWFGLRLPKQKEWIPIATLRCSVCGYIESYARPEFAAK